MSTSPDFTLILLISPLKKQYSERYLKEKCWSKSYQVKKLAVKYYSKYYYGIDDILLMWQTMKELDGQGV